MPGRRIHGGYRPFLYEQKDEGGNAGGNAGNEYPLSTQEHAIRTLEEENRRLQDELSRAHRDAELWRNTAAAHQYNIQSYWDKRVQAMEGFIRLAAEAGDDHEAQNVLYEAVKYIERSGRR